MSLPWTRIASHVDAPAAPPAADVDRFWYGVAQPFVGLKLLVADGELRRLAVLPVLVVLALAAIIVDHDERSWADLAFRYYATIVTLSSVPAILFAGRYARLAARAGDRLGFGPLTPLAEALLTRVKHAVRQAVLIAVAVAPLVVLLRVLPLVGDLLVLALTGLWALHWIVVEALDSARLVDPRPAEPARPRPWFVAWTEAAMWQRVPLGGLVARFGRAVTRLAHPWADEVTLVRSHPALAVGFGLAAAAILAVPVANLMLRPAILIGAVHLRGQLRRTTAFP